MTIYIQSRGKSQDHDYTWLKIEGNSQEPEIPHVLKAIKPEELIDSQNPSIILARSGEHLVLLATALDTQDGRTDFMGRQIRNSVAWVEEYSDESQLLLRKIAVQALEGKLKSDIQEAVRNVADSRFGFEADFAKLQDIERMIGKGEIGNEKTGPYLLKVGKDCPQLRKELVEDLKTYQLPESLGDAIFVVVTTMKFSDGLKAKEVWRGLSSRIETENRDAPDWEKYKKKQKQAPQDTGTAKKIPIVSILVLLIVGAIAIAVLMGMQAPQNVQPQEQSTMHPSMASSDKTELSAVASPQMSQK